MDYFGAKYYESSSGRWLSADPMADRYPGWSSYNYVEDNPERNVDPDGKDPDPTGISELTIGGAIETGILITATYLVTKNYLEHPSYSNFPSRSNITNTGIVLGVALFNKLANWFSSNKSDNESGSETPNASKTYAPDRPLPRDKDGNPIPESASAHTELGTKFSKRRGKKYNQAREFGENGKHVKDIDFTDHDRPQEHTNPHQHRIDPETGKRLGQEPLIDK